MSGYVITCCHECPDRTPGCHGTCERYKGEKAAHAKKVEAWRAAHMGAYSAKNQLIDSVYKRRKRGSRRR